MLYKYVNFNIWTKFACLMIILNEEERNHEKKDNVCALKVEQSHGHDRKFQDANSTRRNSTSRPKCRVLLHRKFDMPDWRALYRRGGKCSSNKSANSTVGSTSDAHFRGAGCALRGCTRTQSWRHNAVSRNNYPRFPRACFYFAK